MLTVYCNQSEAAYTHSTTHGRLRFVGRGVDVIDVLLPHPPSSINHRVTLMPRLKARIINNVYVFVWVFIEFTKHDDIALIKFRISNFICVLMLYI